MQDTQEKATDELPKHKETVQHTMGKHPDYCCTQPADAVAKMACGVQCRPIREPNSIRVCIQAIKTQTTVTAQLLLATARLESNPPSSNTLSPNPLMDIQGDLTCTDTCQCLPPAPNPAQTPTTSAAVTKQSSSSLVAAASPPTTPYAVSA